MLFKELYELLLLRDMRACAWFLHSNSIVEVRGKWSHGHACLQSVQPSSSFLVTIVMQLDLIFILSQWCSKWAQVFGQSGDPTDG